MMEDALELMNTLKLRQLPPGNGSECRDEDVRGVLEFLKRVRVVICICLNLGTTDANMPFAGGFAVLRVDDFVSELDVAHDFVLFHHLF